MAEAHAGWHVLLVHCAARAQLILQKAALLLLCNVIQSYDTVAATVVHSLVSCC
jgi:hypothetical protein